MTAAQLALGVGDSSARESRTADTVVAAANAVRTAGCSGHPGTLATLRAEPRLDAVATELSRGRSLDEALANADYRATAAAATRIAFRRHVNESNGDWLHRALAQRFCEQLTSAEFASLGAVRDGRGVWLVLASPFAPPGPELASEVTARVLELVNAARLRGRQCGDTQFDPAPALTRSPVLDGAAIAHVRDLVVLGELAHRGSDGGRPADRVNRQGYAWSQVAENLASGATSAEQVVAGWFDSPAHCANLMNPGFTDMGIAYLISPVGAGEIYWVQVLAAP